MDFNINKLKNETKQDWKIRLCLGKLKKLHDLDWIEILELLNLNVSADHLRKVSYGYLEYEQYLKNDGVHNRILSCSDLHAPYQHPVSIFSDYVGSVDVLQLNGDILDCQSISKFPKAYRVSMIEEMIVARQYIIDLIEYIKPKKVSINFGNHEMRFQSYMSKNLGDSDVLELMPETALDLICVDGFNHYDKRNKTKTWYEPLCEVFTDIEVEYTANWWSQIGNTIFCHPLAFKSGIMATAEKAMYWFRNEQKSFTSLVMAHTHRVGEYVVGNTTLYEQGCCCQTNKMNYSDGRLTNSQKEGFIYICQDEQGNIIKDKTKLICLN